MSTFEILFLILVTICVISSLYFAISDKIMTIKTEEKNDKRYSTQADWENQIKVLTVRIGEITTENDRLNKVCRIWIEKANTYKLELDKKNKELEELIKQSEEHKAKYLKVDSELNKISNIQINV